MSDLNQPTRYFRGLQQEAFMRLEHAASLKGLLKPFKGKGDLEAWASQCFAMRDELIDMAQRQVLAQACGHPFHLLPVELAQQTTGAGTVFLRWRRHDRSAMGVALWQEQIASTSTPVNLLADLHAIELQRHVEHADQSAAHPGQAGTGMRQQGGRGGRRLPAPDRIHSRCDARSVIAPGIPARARSRRGTGISTTTEITP